MKGCELCGGIARMYCESDQASLCWSCDEKVHCANFLVAKHCRNLLCQVCQSPTPWKASGPKLGPTVSICESCLSLHNNNNSNNNDKEDGPEESLGGNEHHHEFDTDDDEDEDEDDSEDEYEDEDEDDVDDEEDGDNQVVPWSATSPSPPAASSSSSEEEEEEISSRCLGGSAAATAAVQRLRKNTAYLDSDDEIGCSSSQTGSFRPLKRQRRAGEEELQDEEDDQHQHQHHHLDLDGQAGSRSTAIIDSLKRLQSEMVTENANASATILGICRLSRDQHHSR